MFAQLSATLTPRLEEGEATLLGVMTPESLGLMPDAVKQELRKMVLRV